ncbi:MAG: amidohydrolase [Propionibacteriales bacterium]|nr:amidohydrolase [Propionibacteriales bacterium]
MFPAGSEAVEGAERTPAPTTVAVAAGRIVAVGGDRVRELAGAATDVVDLAGGLLVPGFQDAHVHPVQGGIERRSCDLSPYDSEGAYLRAVGEYAHRHPDKQWVTGGGWMLPAFPGGLPHAELLDRVVSDRPVFLPNRDHHGAWVNSRALELAGITAATPDPADGRIERDADGQPTGLLHEGAMELVGRLLPVPSLAEQVAALLEAQGYLHSLGITAWQDAILGTYANLTDATAAYLACVDAGTLTAKVVGALWWDRTRGAEQIPELVQRRALLSTDRFRATSVKIMQDGIAENFTAAMTSPYLDRCGGATRNAGHSMVPAEALSEHVVALDTEGFQVHVHAIGDRAIRESLDAFTAARARNGRSVHRHHIAHLQVIHPTDLDRFAELDVTATMQPLWAVHDEQMDVLTVPFLGAERAGWQYPFAALAACGARLAAGSDWPVSTPDPLAGIHVAVNRRLPADGSAPAFMPEQALDVRAALSAYTAGSSYVNSLDDTGRIALGAAADLAVLDRDIVTGTPEAIGEASVVATYVDGVQVYPT